MKFRFSNNCLKAHFKLMGKKVHWKSVLIVSNRVKWSSVLLLTVTIILPFYTVGDFFFFLSGCGDVTRGRKTGIKGECMVCWREKDSRREKWTMKILKMKRETEPEREGGCIRLWQPILYHSDPSLAMIDGIITIWIWDIYIRQPQLFTAKYFSLNTWPHSST